ncbi:integrase catalytic region [Caballeronia choica]|jgi:transposase-like protein|uniref:Integrase catalytic region n=1 Tax=Caballeronia choica TaxID=326476 RepID=A0A158KLB3_9BURK|nr:integrase catalytic region [Caballeronia choica]
MLCLTPAICSPNDVRLGKPDKVDPSGGNRALRTFRAYRKCDPRERRAHNLRRQHKRSVGKSSRVDETYIKVGGQWKFLYRAVDKACKTVDFLLRAHRDKAAARRFLGKAIDQNGAPQTITVDKSGAKLAALEALNAKRETPIKIRQSK